MSGNAGYARGMNAGIQRQLEKGARWIWLLTHDVRLRTGALAAMVRASEEGSHYGALGPRLLQAENGKVFSLGGERTRRGRLYNLGFDTPLDDDSDSSVLRRCAWLDGSSIMLRAQALRDVGLYDTSFFGYTEDADLCLRLERAGWSVGVVNAAVAEQTSGHLVRPGPVTFLRTRNELRYACRLAGRPGMLPPLGSQILESARYMRRVITGPERRLAAVRGCTTWIGVAAFFSGRTGPPPAWLPGKGDMTTT